MGVQSIWAKMRLKDFTKRHVVLLLLLILASSFVTRFWDISSVGLVYWDSGEYVREAAWFIGEGGRPMPWKPFGYPLLVSMGFLLFGVQDFVAIGVSAFMGVLTVLMVFLMARKLFNERIALLASALLSVMEYHIIYSRIAITDASFTFFLTLSLYLFLIALEKNKVKYFALFGLLAGITMDIRFIGFLSFGVPAAYLTVKYARSHLKKKLDVKFLKRHIKLMSLAFAILLLVHSVWFFALGVGTLMSEDRSKTFQIAELSPGSLLANTPKIFQLGIEKYIELNIGRNSKAIQTTIKNSEENKSRHSPESNLIALIVWISPVILLLVLLSFYKIPRDDNHLFLYMWFLILLILCFTVIAGRVHVGLMFLPPLSIVAARGLTMLKDERLFSLVLGLALVSSLWMAYDNITEPHNGARKTVEFLMENVRSGEFVYEAIGPYINFYNEDSNFWWDHRNPPNESIRYIVLDYRLYKLYSLDYELLQSEKEPVAVFSNPNPNAETMDWIRREIADYDKLKIYKITPEDAKRYFYNYKGRLDHD